MAFFIGSQFAGRAWFSPTRCGVASYLPNGNYVRGEQGSRGVWRIRKALRETSKGLNKDETGVNWRKIKAEYIAGGISQRALAEKYGVSRTLVMRIANKEKWTEKRAAAETKAMQIVEQRTAEEIADTAVLLEQAKKALLRRVVGMIDKFPDKGAQVVKTKQNGSILTYSLKDIAAVLAVVESKQEKGKAADIEDLAPLAELLRDE